METESGIAPWIPQFAAFSVAVVGLLTVGIGWLERSDRPYENQTSLTRAIISLALGVAAIAMEAIPIPRSRRRLGVTVALSGITVVAAVGLLVWIARQQIEQVNLSG